MGFVGLLPFPSNKDMDSLVLKYSELVDGSICVGYKPGRLPFMDDFQVSGLNLNSHLALQ
jgi:hypothetical protein